MAALVPPAVVTKTLAVPALPTGVVQVAVVLLVTLKAEHATPPMLITDAYIKPVPEMVMELPPAVRPLAFEMKVTVGAGKYVN